jgi:hypothetical protein
MADKGLSFTVSVEGVSQEASELSKLTVQLKNLKKERDELIKQASRPGHIASKEERLQIAAYNKEITEQSKRQKELAKVIDSAEGSLNRKRAALIKMKEAYAAASPEIAQKMLPALNKLTTEVTKSEQAMGVYSRNVGNYSSAFDLLPGPLSRAGNGVKMLNNSFKALLANPIGAAIAIIVVALTSLFKAFKSTDSGGTELAARFEQLKAILDVFRQRIINVTNAIGNLFKGNFKQAAADMKEAFTGIGNQIKEATKAAYEYQYALDRTKDAESNYISQAAENRNKIARLEYSAQDRTKSTEERRKALQEAISIGEEEVKQQQDFAKQKLDNEINYLAGRSGLRAEDVLSFIRMTDQEQENADQSLKTLRNNNETKFDEIEKLYSAWLEADTKFYEENKRNISRLSGFEEEQRKEKEQAEQAEKDRKLQTEQEMADKLLQMKKENGEIQKIQVRNTEENNLNTLKEYTGLTVDEIKKRTKAIEKLEQENADAKVRIAASATNLIAGLAGKNKAAQKASLIADKAMTIAEIIIQTRKANAGLRASAALVPFPANLVAMTIAQAAIIKNNIAAGIDIAATVAATATGLAGFSRGGYTKRGNKYKPAGIVHENEWVANEELVNSPVTGPIISNLERMRLTMGGSGAVAKAKTGPFGYASGGYVQQLPMAMAPEGIDYDKFAKAIQENVTIAFPVNKVVSAVKELNMITDPQRI